MSLARYVATTAPAGFALVQGLLNTRETASGFSDLLADDGSAAAWLAAGLQEWAERTENDPVEITASARDLRALRSRVRSYVAGDRAGVHFNQQISIVANPDGTLRTQPSGRGIRWLESAMWGELLIAQNRGELPRLKLCRNEFCGSAFYDRSKNNSGVWHDVHVCGNAANLRASRARRKAT